MRLSAIALALFASVGCTRTTVVSGAVEVEAPEAARGRRLVVEVVWGYREPVDGRPSEASRVTNAVSLTLRGERRVPFEVELEGCVPHAWVRAWLDERGAYEPQAIIPRGPLATPRGSVTSERFDLSSCHPARGWRHRFVTLRLPASR